MSDLVIRKFAWADVPAVTAIYRYYAEETVITFETEAPSEAAIAERFGGLVDSIGAMELLSFMEDEFGIVVQHTDIDEANFGSIDRIARFVAAGRSGGR